MGNKSVRCYTNEGWVRSMGASVAEVDKPLLSVARMVNKGATVVFSPEGSYVDNPSGTERIHLTKEKGLFTMKVWVPRIQTNGKYDKGNGHEHKAPFPGQA